MADQTREKNPNWQGGKIVDQRGYVLIRVGVGHHLADVRGYAYEHRLLAEQRLGRQLRPGEVVRRTAAKTPGLRTLGEDNPQVTCECGCGVTFFRFDADGRRRRFVSGHNLKDRQ